VDAQAAAQTALSATEQKIFNAMLMASLNRDSSDGSLGTAQNADASGLLQDGRIVGALRMRFAAHEAQGKRCRLQRAVDPVGKQQIW
jgi:hypothetical protein